MTGPQSRKSARRARWLSAGHGRARPDIRQSSQIVRQLVELDAIRRAFVGGFTVAQLVGPPSISINELTRGTQIPIAPVAPPYVP
jgi:hypothetical protein